jgi:hypothetical protein
VETGGSYSGPIALPQIYPGDDATITTPSRKDYTATRVDSRYTSIKGTISGKAANRIMLSNGSVINLNPKAVILMNGRRSSFNKIVIGMQAQFRVNPTTNESWWVNFAGTGTGPAPAPVPGGTVSITEFTHNAVNKVLAPGDTVRFTMRGTVGGKGTFTIPGTTIKGPMTERSPGYYEGSYKIVDIDKSVNVQPVVSLEVPGYHTRTLKATNPIAIQKGRITPSAKPTPLPAPFIMSPKNNSTVKTPFTISGKASPNSIAVIRVQQTANLGPIGAQLGTLERREKTDSQGNFQTTVDFPARPSGLIYKIQAYQLRGSTKSPVMEIQVKQQ